MKNFILISSFFINFAISFKTIRNTDNPCEGISNGMIPYEPDCNYYIHCINQVGSIQRCPVMYIFDPNQLRCVAGNPETCEITTTTMVPTTITPPDCPSTDDPLNPIFHPHPYDCSKYFMCFNGSAIPRECYDGLLWSVENEWCDYPENVSCDLNILPTPPPPFCSDWILCPSSGFGYLPNFNLCHRYFECIFAVRHMRTCPEGEIFDVASLRCSNSETALCVINAECID